MEQTNNNFPKFDEGQVLTSQALNNYFGYLDEQQRLTRAKLLGVGIIDGLGVNYVGSKLIIRKGTAVTADGYLIELPEDTTYTLMHKYDKKSTVLATQNPLIETVDKDFETALKKVEYVFYKDKSDAAEHNVSSTSPYYFNNEWLKKYDIALMVDFASQDTITKCNELSCDIVQNNYQIEIRPVLINKTLIGEDYYLDLTTSEVEVSLDKIINVIDFDFNNFAESFQKLSEPLFLIPKNHRQYFIKTFYEQLIAIYTEIDKVKKIINLFGTILFVNVSESNMTAIEQRLESMQNNADIESMDGPLKLSGYYLDFLFQFRIAIQEFLTTYYEFIWKYKKIPNNAKAFPRIVVIGFDNLRRQTRFLKDNSYINELTILRKQFSRIVSMSESIYIEKSDCIKSISNKKISFNYVKKGSRLGEWSVPGFLNSEKLNNWYSYSNAESPLSPNKKIIELDKYEQEPYLSDYDLIIDNYYGKSLYDFYIEYLELAKRVITGAVFPIKEIHYIHIDRRIDDLNSNEGFFSSNEGGCGFNVSKYKEEVFFAYNRSPVLKNNNIFEKIINNITNNRPIYYNGSEKPFSSDDISNLILTIDTSLQTEEDILGIAHEYLKWTKAYLSQFCKVYRIVIGKYQYGGELYVFYSGNRDKNRDKISDLMTEADSNTFIQLIVGSYPSNVNQENK